MDVGIVLDQLDLANRSRADDLRFEPRPRVCLKGLAHEVAVQPELNIDIVGGGVGAACANPFQDRLAR